MFFRTGEFARMLSVEKSVLIYYDRIGLFCPVHVDGNGSVIAVIPPNKREIFILSACCAIWGFLWTSLPRRFRRGTLPRWKRCSEPVHRRWIGKLRA